VKNSLAIVQKYHPEVKRVLDAKDSVSFTVTAEDCKRGKANQPEGCALARAAMKTYDGAIISLSTSYLVKGSTAWRYKTPQTVAREIVSFDRNERFEPGEYHLAKIAPCQALGYRTGQPKGKGVHKKKPSRRVHRTTGIRELV
jgi:hypothetical protein